MRRHQGASALAAIAASEAEWVQAHAALTRLAEERAALDVEEGRWLLRAFRASAHVHLGYGSFAQYVERLFGYRPRTTQEKLRVAEALETLPTTARAIEAGALSWCAARELTRVAAPETERAWLDAARGKTLRELEGLVAQRSPGDTPDAPARETRRTRVLRFEVAPDTFATFREAKQQLRRRAGGSLDDDALLLAMARHVLGGPSDDGRSSYQISIRVCGVCGDGAQAAAGELVPVEAAVVAMAACDGQHLGELSRGPAEPRAANENGGLDGSPCRRETSAGVAPASLAPSASDETRVCGAGSAHVDPATPIASSTLAGLDAAPPVACVPSVPTARVGPGVTERTTTAAPCESSNHAHVGARSPRVDADPSKATSPKPSPRAIPDPPRRAAQTIPPALRRAVLTRDSRRCRVPGCTHATFVDVHHVQPRSEGGRNESSNLVTLCSAHHRAAHRGELLIGRESAGALHFRHADGSEYGTQVAPRAVDAYCKMFAALRHLGFREGEVTAVLRELRADPGLRDASVEQLLREALCRIRPRGR